MSKKLQSKKSSIQIVKKAKAPKVKLLTYTLKAVIPTGQYANLQPEITVQADSIEQAERVVMPYIETMFARYRDAGVLPIQTPVRPVVAQKAPVAPAAAPAPVTPAPVAKAPEKPVQAAPAPVEAAPVAPAAASAIVLTVPFTRAKGAIESCTSLAAIKLVGDQVEKSTKLVDAEKVELRKLVADKLAQLNGK